MSIISISGRLGSGKDLVGEIIQYLTHVDTNTDSTSFEDWQDTIHTNMGDWKTKKFASKLKEITCIILGCTMKQLEDREFKEKELGEEWWVFVVGRDGQYSGYDKDLVAYDEQHLLEDWEDYDLIKLTPRKIMQLLGTDAGRHIIHPQIWVSSLMSGYKDKGCYGRDLHTTQDNDRWISKFPNWIITDTRFPNELKAVKDRSGITIMIRREETDHLSGDHASETALDNAEFDHVISNNGTIEDLIKVVKDILQYRGII